MSAFGDGYPDQNSYRAPDGVYDPYAGAGNPFGSGNAFGSGGPEDEGHIPQHRRGSRLILAAAIGMVALIVVGAVTFAGSVLMSRASTPQPPASAVGAESSTDPSGGLSGEPEPEPTTGPTENATASASPTPGRPTATPPVRATTTPPAKPRTTAAGAGNTSYEARVLAIVNTERAKADCKPLAYNAKLTTAARKHSADMAANNYFSHDSQDGTSFAARISAEGYKWSGAAENIAKGQRTPEDVMKAWMNSSGHRANILNCGLKDLGVGLAYQGRTAIWTQDFGSPQ